MEPKEETPKESIATEIAKTEQLISVDANLDEIRVSQDYPNQRRYKTKRVRKTSLKKAFATLQAEKPV